MFDGRTEAGHEHELRSRERVKLGEARRVNPRPPPSARQRLDARGTTEPSTMMARTALPTKQKTRLSLTG